MTAIEVQLIERLKKLPPSRLAEVVEFLASREERAAAAQRLTDGLARLDALNLPLFTDGEVEAEIEAARQDRRGGRSHQGA